jgi:rubrerythrin
MKTPVMNKHPKGNGRGRSSSKGLQAGNDRARSTSSRSTSKSRSLRKPVSQAWLNDFLSEMLAVEEGGEKLYAKALDELQHNELRAKLEEFHKETQRHIELVREMMQSAGMNESHKSPTAEAAEQKAQGLLSVEIEDHLKDLNNIENLVLAETKDRWDWEMLSSVVSRIEDADLRDVARDAVAEVFKQEREHLQWNEKTLTTLATMSAEQEEPSTDKDDKASADAAQSSRD